MQRTRVAAIWKNKHACLPWTLECQIYLALKVIPGCYSLSHFSSDALNWNSIFCFFTMFSNLQNTTEKMWANWCCWGKKIFKNLTHFYIGFLSQEASHHLKKLTISPTLNHLILRKERTLQCIGQWKLHTVRPNKSLETFPNFRATWFRDMN